MCYAWIYPNIEQHPISPKSIRKHHHHNAIKRKWVCVSVWVLFCTFHFYPLNVVPCRTTWETVTCNFPLHTCTAASQLFRYALWSFPFCVRVHVCVCFFVINYFWEKILHKCTIVAANHTPHIKAESVKERNKLCQIEMRWILLDSHRMWNCEFIVFYKPCSMHNMK